jgi:hypothetical protein
MKWKVIPALMISSLCTTISYGMFCPGNFNIINSGDSIAAVEKLCGAPASKDVKDAPDNSPQEWSYFLQGKSDLMVPTRAQGTLKTTVAFDSNGKVINISVNGVGVSATSNCGRQVSMGMDRDSVESSCGRPSLITKQNQGAQQTSSTDPNDMTNKMVTYTYTNGAAPVKLVFVGGKLTEQSQ